MKWAKTLAMAAALVCLGSVQPTSGCDTGWVDLGDGGVGPCIYFAQAKSTWHGMKTICEDLGGYLAKVSGNLHQNIVDYINDQGDGVLDDEAFWIGGTDEAVEGVWRWDVDDTIIPLGTPHWYPCNDQPNGGTTQNHLSLYTPDFYFHSLESTRQIMGICEKMLGS